MFSKWQDDKRTGDWLASPSEKEAGTAIEIIRALQEKARELPLFYHWCLNFDEAEYGLDTMEQQKQARAFDRKKT